MLLPPKKVLPLTMLHAACCCMLLPLKLNIFKRSSARSSLLLLLWLWLWPLPLTDCDYRLPAVGAAAAAHTFLVTAHLAHHASLGRRLLDVKILLALRRRRSHW